jgi:hypothetical protein
MLLGRAELVLQIFFPKRENNFEADFSRAKVRDVFASRSPLGRSPTQNYFLTSRKKIYKIKPTLPNNFSLGPNGV